MSDADAGPPPAPRLLLVDDNDAERSALHRLLELHGFRVENVADGVSALARIDSGNPFDVLLTDLRLPDLDGREIALHASRLVPRPMIVLGSGFDLDSGEEERRRWGIDLVLTKPLDLSSLVAQIRSGLDGRRVEGRSQPA